MWNYCKVTLRVAKKHIFGFIQIQGHFIGTYPLSNMTCSLLLTGSSKTLGIMCEKNAEESSTKNTINDKVLDEIWKSLGSNTR